MDLRSGALVIAHGRGVWNQASREAGQAAKIGGAIVIAVVAVFLLPISVSLFVIAKKTGMSLAASSDAAVLSFWAGEQALFAFFFPLFGSVRFKPSFPMSGFGRFPVSRLELLLAEVPASLLEAFPILGIGGILVTNAALAVAMPRMIPAIAVVTITSVVWFVSTMFAVSAIVGLLIRSRLATLLALCVAVVAAAFSGMLGMRAVFRGLKTAINVWLPRLIDALPLTRGYEGILALHDGAISRGLTLVAAYAGATTVIAAIAVVVHARRLSAESETLSWRLAPERALRFRTPAAGIGAVYVRQLLASGAGRTGIVVALFMTTSLSFVVGIIRSVEAEGKPLPPELMRSLHLFDVIPWFAAFPLFVIVGMASQIWTNQFGLDADSIRGMLALPIEPAQMLLGKTFGLAKYFAVQLAAGLLPIVAFAPPDAQQVIAGAAIATIAAVLVAALGQALSVRFPRSLKVASSGGTLPLYLSWIPTVTLLALGSLLFVMHTIGDLAVRGGGAALLVVAAIALCFAYRAALPMLAAWMTTHQERLLTM